MKSERRHELETNVLADWLGRQLTAARQHGRLIAWVLATIVVVAGIWMIVARVRSGRLATAWEEVSRLTSQFYMQDQLTAYRDELRQKFNEPERNLTPAEIETVEERVRQQIADAASKYDGTPAGAYASLYLADWYRVQGQRGIFAFDAVRRDEARQQLADAIAHYQRALRGATAPDVQDRIRFGLASTYEARALSGGPDADSDLQHALAQYEPLQREGCPYAPLARQSAQLLRDGRLAWMPTQLQQRSEDPHAGLPGFPFPGSGPAGSNLPGTDSDSFLPGSSLLPPGGLGTQP
jgi:hypothetical protein